jgi:hypothetical protein
VSSGRRLWLCLAWGADTTGYHGKKEGHNHLFLSQLRVSGKNGSEGIKNQKRMATNETYNFR